jgi:hypothetical protein
MARRVVTLVLITRAGEVVGALPPFPVAVPWWSEVASVVDGARATCGADVTVLRLLDAPHVEPVEHLGAAHGGG